MSGLPPPLPPTCWATKFTSSPALTLPVLSAVTLAASCTLSPSTAANQLAGDAATTPLRNPEAFQFDLNLRDIAEVWRRGSVISSWLLDLTAAALAKDPDLAKFDGQVSDSGEGRWTIKAAIDAGVPTPVLSTALYSRFSSRGEAAFADKLLSAMRFEFGGHKEKPADK
jgi:6-phosphogluconate dehydrogenase